jgi:hypothetical protein
MNRFKVKRGHIIEHHADTSAQYLHRMPGALSFVHIRY